MLQHLRLNFLHSTYYIAILDICFDGCAQLEHGMRLPLRCWAARHCRSAHAMAGQTCFCTRQQEIYISFAGSDMQAVAITTARRF